MVYKTPRKILWKVEKLSAPYDAEGVWKGAQYHRKGEEIISALILEGQNSESPIWDFWKNAPQRIERSEEGKTELMTLSIFSNFATLLSGNEVP